MMNVALLLFFTLPLSGSPSRQGPVQQTMGAGQIASAAQGTDPRLDEKLNLPTPKNPALPALWIVGDSTVRNGHGDGANGQWGWGEPLVNYFDPAKINVVN